MTFTSFSHDNQNGSPPAIPAEGILSRKRTGRRGCRIQHFQPGAPGRASEPQGAIWEREQELRFVRIKWNGREETGSLATEGEGQPPKM